MIATSFRDRSARRFILRLLCLGLGLSIPATPLSALAQETATEREALLRSAANRGDGAEFVLNTGRGYSGEIVAFRDQRLRVRTYDDRTSRFRTDEYPLENIAQLVVLHRKKNAFFPLAGGALVAGAGIWLAMGLTDPPDYREDRTDVVLTLGILGFSVGALAGFLMAPTREVPILLWSFE